MSEIDAPAPRPVPTPPPEAGIGDALEIYWAPAAVFARRREGGFFVPLLVLTVVLVVLYYLLLPVTQPLLDAEFARAGERALAQNPELRPEQLEAMRDVQVKFSGAGIALFVPIALQLLGVVVTLGGKLAGSAVTFGQGATIATFAYFPRLVEQLATAVQCLLLDADGIVGRQSVNLGLGRLLGADADPTLVAFLLRVDVFTLWVTALIAVGLVVIGRLERPRAWGVAAAVWLVGALPTVVPAFLQGAE